ncbi:hypothetical protein GH810_03425 [Acetobacterium paludosum]|uniref:Uncharacterized protein n=1 Tax=Acetobacterium paludosum TaxID=52693 RepID=A0A923KNQ7_9FIRM|nr:hypothetical protein [Acetobacterium paludosum]MBC3887359.1 hypothetical protein [Acetobacterium paludosum]
MIRKIEQKDLKEEDSKIFEMTKGERYRFKLRYGGIFFITLTVPGSN